MTHDNHDVCRGLLAWEQIGGLLVRGADGVFTARCPKCGGVTKRANRPTRLGTLCHRLAPKPGKSRGTAQSRRLLKPTPDDSGGFRQ